MPTARARATTQRGGEGPTNGPRPEPKAKAALALRRGALSLCLAPPTSLRSSAGNRVAGECRYAHLRFRKISAG